MITLKDLSITPLSQNVQITIRPKVICAMCKKHVSYTTTEPSYSHPNISAIEVFPCSCDPRKAHIESFISIFSGKIIGYLRKEKQKTER